MKLLTIPYLLNSNQGSLDDQIHYLNENFFALASGFNGFQTAAQPPTSLAGFGGTAGPNDLVIGSLPMYTNTPTDTGIVMQPQITLFIDPPHNATGNINFPLNQDDEYPNGANMNASKLAVIFTATATNRAATDGEKTFYTFTVGSTNFYPCGFVNVSLRNGGSTDTHEYLIIVSASVYSSDTSQFH